MQNLGLVLLVFSFVLALIAAFMQPTVWPRAHLGWLAFAFFVAAELFGGITRIFHVLVAVALLVLVGGMSA